MHRRAARIRCGDAAWRRDRCGIDVHRGFGIVDPEILARPAADVPVRPEARVVSDLRLRRLVVSRPAGGHARCLAARSARAHDTGRRSGGHQRRLRAHRTIQGHERDARGALARGAQRRGDRADDARPAVRLADGPGGGGREAVLVAGHRLAARRQRVRARHPGRAGMHPAHRPVLPRRQHAGRHRLRGDRPAHQVPDHEARRQPR